MRRLITVPSGIRLLRPIVALAARPVLRDRFTRREIRGVLEDTFEDYERRRSEIPVEKEVGGRLMVHLAALTAGFYRTLRARGMRAEEARRATAFAARSTR